MSPVLKWACIAIAAFFVLKHPTEAASAVGNALNAIGAFITNL